MPSGASAAPAAARYAQADHALVSAAGALARCQSNTGASGCAKQQRRLNGAGRRLSAAERRFTPARSAAANRRRAAQGAPTLEIVGSTLRWTKTANVGTYVLVRRTAGHPDFYSVSTGTVARSYGTAGRTGRYRVRTAVVGSVWSRPAKDNAPASGAGKKTRNPAPATATPTTTSTTVTQTTAPAPATAPATSPAPSSGAFQFGINSGSALQWELGFIKPLGAKHVRAEFPIGTTVATMAPTIEAYAKAGVQPLLLAGFHGRLATADEIANVATWAAAFGPNGTFWVGKSYPASVQVSDIEFGNEVNNPWFYNDGSSRASDWYKDPIFLQRARDYARTVRDASLAVKGANPGVGLLAVGDEYAGYTTWIDAMFQAVPDLGRYVTGWTVHPYGPQWHVTMDAMITATRAHGAPDLPLYATEWGISTDDGRCLTDNFGWDKCMSYASAATALNGAVSGMRAKYGSRLAAIYLYSSRDLSASGADNDREHFFGAVRSDGTSKGAYTDEVKAQFAASS